MDDDQIWQNYFKKQKKYSKLTKEDFKNIKESEEDIKNNKIYALKEKQFFSDFLKLIK